MTSLSHQFLLTSEDCELLLKFEQYPSLQDLCKQMGRDHSIIARALKRISEKFPVVEKKAGKWILTDLGRKINESSKTALAGQATILNERSSLRIGTNREFASRIIAPEIKILKKMFPKTNFSIHTFELGTEAALLQGQIDVGFDCDRPYSPEIAYKLVLDEPIIAVATKEFIKENRKIISEDRYLELPHLLCERLHPDKILSRSDNQLFIECRFNDIATTREACVQGVGWALLPVYAIKKELEQGKLQKIEGKIFGKSKYGVWWLRSRTHLKDTSELLIQWLNTQELNY